MYKKYYYPISSTSLASIFGQACILPTCLYKNRIPDIQSKYENFILLTDKFGVLLFKISIFSFITFVFSVTVLAFICVELFGIINTFSKFILYFL